MDTSVQQTFPWIPICYIGGHSDQNEVRPCGGRFEYLHRSPATKKEQIARGYNWTTLFLGDINTGPGSPGWGSSNLRQENMVLNSVGHGPEND
jgi:hypothetical protein